MRQIFFKKRWMLNLRPLLTRKSANQRPFSPWAYLTKQILQVVT